MDEKENCIIILSDSDRNTTELIVISDDDNRPVFNIRTEKRVQKKSSNSKKKALRCRNAERMTCLKKLEASTGKSWSQLKKERENQKFHSPCKKPRLSNNLKNNLFTSFHSKNEVCSETEFSDDLPDIDDSCSVSSSRLTEVNSHGVPHPATSLSTTSSDPSRPAVSNRVNKPKPVVFDETAKAKFAAWLTNVKSKQCVKSDSVSPKSPKKEGNPSIRSGGNRHFLDILKGVESETCPTSKTISDSKIYRHSLESETYSTSQSVTDSVTSCPISDSVTFQSLSDNVTTPSISDNVTSQSIADSVPSRCSSTGEESATDLQEDDTDISSIECYSQSSSESDDEWVSKRGTVPTFRKCGLLRTVRVTGSKLKSSNQCDIKQFFPTTTSEPNPKLGHSTSVFSKGKQVYLKKNRPMFPKPQIIEDSLATSLSDMHINTIEAALEEGDSFLDYSLRLVEDFLLKPTESIVQEITSRGLLGDSSLKVVIKSGKLLSTILQKYPTLIKVEWEVVQKMFSMLTLNKDSSTASNLYPKVCLLLDLICTGFQVELSCSKLSNPYEVRKTQAYKLLSSDCAFGNLKQIVQWIRSIVTSEEYTELRDSRLEQQLNRQLDKADGDNVYVPKLLPNLQKLLEIGVNVSRSCVEAAKRIGGEMVHTYMYLPDVSHKKLFLQSVSCDLLQFKVVQRILEDNCDMTYVSCEDFPCSLNDIIDAYFQARPPSCPMTPPQSPSDDENDDVGDMRSFSQFSTSSCEELALLVHCVTQSYLRCAQGYQQEPLSQRVRLHQHIRPLCDTVKASQSLSVKVSDFYGHLVTLTTELNPATHQYLMLLQSMADSIS